jgi:uncharacterized membrane protein
MSARAPSAADQQLHRVELLISGILRAGVCLSFLLIVAGTLVTFLHHPSYLASEAALQRLTRPGAAFPHTAREELTAIRELRGQAVVVLGLAVLVATPVLRVAVSIAAFAVQRDRAFVLITCVVLALLLLSFFLGRGGG